MPYIINIALHLFYFRPSTILCKINNDVNKSYFHRLFQFYWAQGGIRPSEDGDDESRGGHPVHVPEEEGDRCREKGGTSGKRRSREVPEAQGGLGTQPRPFSFFLVFGLVICLVTWLDGWFKKMIVCSDKV